MKKPTERTVIVQFSKELYAILEALSKKHEVSRSELVRRAVKVNNILSGAVDDGYKLILRNEKTGEQERLRLV